MQNSTLYVMLASSSPRRLQLLQTLGFKVMSFAPNVDETPLKAERPYNMVIRLARLKANTATETNYPIVAADTAVCIEKNVLGKPVDQDDAIRMLTLLSGKTRTVMTGYAVKKNEQEIIGCVSTKVCFRHLTKAEILRYVETQEPFNKAGGYAIQGLGASLIDKLQGSYTNVIGLPVLEVLQALQS